MITRPFSSVVSDVPGGMGGISARLEELSFEFTRRRQLPEGAVTRGFVALLLLGGRYGARNAS